MDDFWNNDDDEVSVFLRNAGEIFVAMRILFVSSPNLPSLHIAS